MGVWQPEVKNVVRRPADALGMTLVWLAMSGPVLFVLWLALTEPQYGWITAVFNSGLCHDYAGDSQRSGRHQSTASAAGVGI
jgi:hypothetical protein